MFEDTFELYNLLKLPLDKQNAIIKDLIASDLSISQENVTKLNSEIEVGRINYFLETAIKAAKPKPVKKPLVVHFAVCQFTNSFIALFLGLVFSFFFNKWT